MLHIQSVHGADKIPRAATVHSCHTQFLAISQFRYILFWTSAATAANFVDIQIVQDAPQPARQKWQFPELSGLAKRPFDAVLDQIVRQGRIAAKSTRVAP